MFLVDYCIDLHDAMYTQDIIKCTGLHEWIHISRLLFIYMYTRRFLYKCTDCHQTTEVTVIQGMPSVIFMTNGFLIQSVYYMIHRC